MFRRSHHEESTPQTVDPPVSGAPSAPTHDLDQAYYNRAVANDKAIASLHGRGEKVKVALESMTLLYQAAPDPDFEGFEELVQPAREWEATATVQPSRGEAFVAHFRLYANMIGTEPKVGDLVNVFFDPADPGVCYGTIIEKFKPSVMWKVPANCPECGAPVDQSTESMAEHPTCHQCHNPLPCEPA